MTILSARPSAKFGVIAPAGFRILSALDQAAQACRFDLVITCGTDGHPPADPHATGEAYDVSVKGMAPETIIDLTVCLERLLGPLFTVLYEVPVLPPDPRLKALATLNVHATGPHVHVQRKHGTTFPPVGR